MWFGIFRSSPGTLTDGGQSQPRLDAKGALVVSSEDGSGNPQGTLPAGTDRSGSAATSSGQIVAANSARKGLEIQNIGANNIGINEFGGTAEIGTAGTYTIAPGASMKIRTNRAVTAIAATGTTAFTATEW